MQRNCNGAQLDLRPVQRAIHEMNAHMHRGAVHEAGHAVVAYLLGAKLGPIKVDRADPEAPASAGFFWPNGEASPAEQIRVARASSICLLAFGYDLRSDIGPLRDEVLIGNALEKMFRDDDAAQENYRDEVDAELSDLFKKPNVRAAVQELVRALTCKGEIDGAEAQTIAIRYLSEAP